MSIKRDAMIKSLKKVVIPVLRERGFKGSYPHFYRKLENQTDLIMFQFSMWGGVLYVEISKCSSEGYINYSGKHILPNKVRVYDIGGLGDDGLPHRTRIGKEINGTFEFKEHNTEEVSRKVVNSLEEAEEWWSSHPNWWNN
ncbi:DUF4304 domain-containing protein [Peribacillus asahii]|uniref:DUF4304 domain-containing protein n=1 Tax=Peribacillus asahii TaxID=228899 RepID=UPI00207ADEAB|nr:DUF4304 domain-containing protein [Peribacillus asahii]USK68531.1 DUF4304 domain-containing protein [Peribacillus asahii]